MMAMRERRPPASWTNRSRMSLPPTLSSAPPTARIDPVDSPVSSVARVERRRLRAGGYSDFQCGR
jgi:hypothetical protein